MSRMFLVIALSLSLAACGNRSWESDTLAGSYDRPVSVTWPELSDKPEPLADLQEDLDVARGWVASHDGTGSRGAQTSIGRAHQARAWYWQDLWREPGEPVVIDWVHASSPGTVVDGWIRAVLNGRTVPLRCLPVSTTDPEASFPVYETVLREASAEACRLDQRSSLEPVAFSLVLESEVFAESGREQLTIVHVVHPSEPDGARPGTSSTFNVFHDASGEMAPFELSPALETRALDPSDFGQEDGPLSRFAMVPIGASSETPQHMSGPSDTRLRVALGFADGLRDRFDEPIALLVYVEHELVFEEQFAPTGDTIGPPEDGWPVVEIDLELEPGTHRILALLFTHVGRAVVHTDGGLRSGFNVIGTAPLFYTVQ